MEKRNNRKGFTLAELLIVVAIIAVLVAIAIPVFSTQLEKSRESTDAANVRSAYAEVVTTYLADNSIISINVAAKQTISKWQTNPAPVLTYQGGNGSQATFSFNAKTVGNSYVVTMQSDSNANVKPMIGND